MLDVYKKMEAEGKIGKFYKDANGILRARPFQEYPKLIRVHMPNGQMIEKVVHNAREELAAQSYETSVGETDPVVKERNELLEMVAERDAKAQTRDQELAQVRAELEDMRRLLIQSNEVRARSNDDE